ncbi:unnamed protein product, partial [Pylaiella littoralis]
MGSRAKHAVANGGKGLTKLKTNRRSVTAAGAKPSKRTPGRKKDKNKQLSPTFSVTFSKKLSSRVTTQQDRQSELDGGNACFDSGIDLLPVDESKFQESPWHAVAASQDLRNETVSRGCKRTR